MPQRIWREIARYGGATLPRGDAPPVFSEVTSMLRWCRQLQSPLNNQHKGSARQREPHTYHLLGICDTMQRSNPRYHHTRFPSLSFGTGVSMVAMRSAGRKTPPQQQPFRLGPAKG